jgi:hypothetical protein
MVGVKIEKPANSLKLAGVSFAMKLFTKEAILDHDSANTTLPT